MSTEIIYTTVQVVEPVTRRPADNDETLICLWLHGRSSHTQRAYRADADAFFRTVGKALAEVTLNDLQNFADSQDQSLEPASKHRRLSAIKSLFSFASKIGYLRFDTARPLRLPPVRDRLSERILTEVEVRRMLALERHPRNHALLYLLYASGIRVSEACQIKWSDVQERQDAGQITVLAKGAKSNTILLPSSVWRCLIALREMSSLDAPVFRSRKGAHLHPTQVRRIVRTAAKRAGVEKAVSPHWMRHAHASHALDHGAPIHLVQTTLGHASVATTGRYLHARPSDSSSNYLQV